MLTSIILLLLPFSLLAHQSSLTTSGKELFWAIPNIPLTISNSTTDLTSAEVYSIISNSMNEWNQSSVTKLSYSQSSTNEIKFVRAYPLGSAVLGTTEISYNSSGAIQKASILLNDDYHFQSTPGFYPTGQVYLGDVVVHELGHLFGLSHSEVLNSSMFYSSFSGQSSLASDDRGGIRNKYSTQFGSITGHVRGGNSIGVLGVHVQAISRLNGESTGAISDENGYFKIGGLDLNDTYYIYTSPVKNPDSLPNYFSNSQNQFCPSSYVGSFFSSCGRENDGKPLPLTLSQEHPSLDVGTVSINCNLHSDEEYDYQKLQTHFLPLTIFDYSKELRSEKAFVGWFRTMNTNTWSQDDLFKIDLTGLEDLTGTSKYLRVVFVSYPFGGPLEYEMKIKRTGQSASTIKNISYSSITETYNPDFYVDLPLGNDPSQNLFEVSVRAKKLSSSYAAQTFPSYMKFTSDQHQPYLIISSILETSVSGLSAILDSKANLSDNAACLDAAFTFAVKKTAGSDEVSNLNTDQSVAAASCGTIDPPSSGPGPSLTQFVSGFLLIYLASSLMKRRKKFLS